jgi:L-arabinose 1-dehydrogenase
MLRLGIIGLGGVSRFYVDAADRARDIELTAVCDRDPARLEPFADRTAIPAYRDVDELLADGRVDAVVLDTPVATHVELSRAALRAGAHVCCEKPLALRVADAHELTDLAEAEGRMLFTAFHRRYNRNLPQPGSLDPQGLRSVELRYLERIDEHTDGDGAWYATPAAEGGGCIVDNGPNAVDVVRHLFGEVSVDGAAVERSPEGVDMRAEVRGRLRGGVEAVIRLDWGYDGEVKDLRARWDDGRELHADMLAGFPAFKSSLDHEYDGVLADFAARVASGTGDPEGLAATSWLERALAAVGTSPRAEAQA